MWGVESSPLEQWPVVACCEYHNEHVQITCSGEQEFLVIRSSYTQEKNGVSPSAMELCKTMFHVPECACLESNPLGAVRDSCHRLCMLHWCMIWNCLKRAITSINVSVCIQSNTTCWRFSEGVYYTLGDMFRPYYSGHLQASILGVAIDTIIIRNKRDLVSRVKTAVYIGIYIYIYIYIYRV
jgi:hypothetical protein